MASEISKCEQNYSFQFWNFRWSQWSRLQWTEFDKLQGTKVRGDRRRIHEVDAGQGVGSDSEEKYNHRRHKNRKHGHAGGQESGKGLRAPVRHRIVVDEGENGVDVPSDQPVPGKVSFLCTGFKQNQFVGQLYLPWNPTRTFQLCGSGVIWEVSDTNGTLRSSSRKPMMCYILYI